MRLVVQISCIWWTGCGGNRVCGQISPTISRLGGDRYIDWAGVISWALSFCEHALETNTGARYLWTHMDKWQKEFAHGGCWTHNVTLQVQRIIPLGHMANLLVRISVSYRECMNWMEELHTMYWYGMADFWQIWSGPIKTNFSQVVAPGCTDFTYLVDRMWRKKSLWSDFSYN